MMCFTEKYQNSLEFSMDEEIEGDNLLTKLNKNIFTKVVTSKGEQGFQA